MDNKIKSQLRAFFVAHRAQQFGFLRDLVRIPSVNEYAVISAFIAAHLETLGFEITRYPLDSEGGGHNLVVRHEFGPGPVVALSAHGDTGASGAGWTHDPFGGEIIDGNIFGRGAASGKSDIAAYVFAVLALREQGTALGGSIELHITFDGETGGDLGAGWLLSNKVTSPDFAVVSGTTYHLITSSSGYLQLEVEIRGQSAPASTPDAGVDALEAAARVMMAIYEYRDAHLKNASTVPGIGSPTLVISQVEGSGGPRKVASRVLLQVERGLIPEEDPGDVENKLTTLIGTSVTAVPGVLCKVRRRALAKAMVSDAGESQLVRAFQRHAKDVLGSDLALQGTPLDTDARHYANAGIPVVLFGAGSPDLEPSRIGGPDEALSLDDLRRSTELLSYVLVDLLNGETAEA